MKKMPALVAFLVAFIYVTFLLTYCHPVEAAPGTVFTDRGIYPIWGIGGTVKITAQNLEPNITYSLWVQKPREFLSQLIGSPFTGVNGTTQAPIPLVIAPSDPSGTYLLSLSRSSTTDTREAVAHFGVMGTNSATYERTKIVTIAGGGFAANSSIFLDIRAGNNSVPGFPVRITAHVNGEFSYTLKLPLSATSGTHNATAMGPTFDKHQTEIASSFFTVTPTTITVQALGAPAPQVERTAETNTNYRLLYPDGSPVTAVNATTDIISSGHRVSSVPLVLVNSTLGEWRATWAPPPSANITTYYFQFNPANFNDAYGNTGQGSPVASSNFKVISAKLQLTIQTNRTLQRTQVTVITLSAKYPNGANVANVTQANVSVTRSDREQTRLVTSLNGALALARLAIPVSASLGNWTLSFSIQDPFGNSGSGRFTVQVQPASLAFKPQTPSTTERTTLLNVTSRVYYPDGTPMNSTVTLAISHGNQTWTPKLNFNSTTSVWSASYYVVQNATLGDYNITWAANDPYGNEGNATSMSVVIPAAFRFLLPSSSSRLDSLSNLDFPVIVRYPNGSSLTNRFGNVSSYYKNSTGSLFTLPLAYNQTNSTWHMFFFTPEEGTLIFSFNATDRYGNSGLAADAYTLKISPSQRVMSQRLILAGVIGALVPVALLTWAIATISARRRKHKP